MSQGEPPIDPDLVIDNFFTQLDNLAGANIRPKGHWKLIDASDYIKSRINALIGGKEEGKKAVAKMIYDGLASGLIPTVEMLYGYGGYGPSQYIADLMRFFSPETEYQVNMLEEFEY
jgi:hypothetical protein